MSAREVHPSAPDGATIAALFVDGRGVYAGLEGVDVWDEARDARLYAGPWPVVAHPPCNKWSPLAFINQSRLPGYRVGDDGGCFAAALEAVRRFGGVLEHPAGSLAWKRYGLPRPTFGMWDQSLLDSGWTCEVEQGAYGHRARKRTWLYYVGPEPDDLIWDSGQYDAIVSGFTHQPKGAHVACEHRRVRPKRGQLDTAGFPRRLARDGPRSRSRFPTQPSTAGERRKRRTCGDASA